MDSSTLLIQAASGLEPLMSKQVKGAIQQSVVAQVSAYVYYESQVIANLTSNKQFQSKFKKMVYDQIADDFSQYLDAKARISPKAYHHIYEWKKVGSSNSRLFKMKRIDSSDLSFKVGYEFLPSKSFVSGKSKHKHVFVNKAEVMEAGKPLQISPRYADRLVFDINGYTVYMPKGKSVFIKNPGGVAVKNSFESAYKVFFKGNLVNESIKKSGFQNLFGASMAKALKLPLDIKRVKYSFSPNTIRSQADNALASAFGGI